MKKLTLSLAALLFASPVGAQDAALNTPVTRASETKLAVKEINIRQDQVVVSLSVQTASSDEVRYYNVVVPDAAPATAAATVVGFLTATTVARTGETGSALRQYQFRVLGYLFDQGYLADTTVQP